MQISTDKEGGSGFDFNRSRKFNRFVDNCEVLDVKAKGCFYTWRNGHDVDVFIQERLDRVLASSGALEKFPNMEVYVPPNSGSDHSML